MKGRRQTGPFSAMPHAVINSAAWDALTGPEMKLLMIFAGKHNGKNNGNISCSWKEMNGRGFVSKDTLARALAGVIAKGFVMKTRQGGRHSCSLFAITWKGIDPCDVPLDIKPSPAPSNAWRDWRPTSDAPAPTIGAGEGKIPAPTIGAPCPDHRGNEEPKQGPVPRPSGHTSGFSQVLCPDHRGPL